MKNKVFYTEIVDEHAHALSEAFDLPLDMEELARELPKAGPGGTVSLSRPLSEYESKAYGIEDDETAFVTVMTDSKTAGKVHRMIVKNPDGFFNEMLGLPPRDFLSDYKDWKKENTFGSEVAYFLGAAQGRQGFEYNHCCSTTREQLQTRGATPRLVRRIVHSTLLKPEFDLNKLAREIDRAMTCPTLKVAMPLVNGALSIESVKELIQALQQHEIRIDSKTATRWVEFCGKRSAWFDSPGSSEKYAHLDEPVFAAIDDALEDNLFFSALIIGPKDWARTSPK